jgi:hypothetical protein
MEKKQYELLPEDQKRDMESETKGSAGLSIIPYLAVSEENHPNPPKESQRNAWKKLTEDQRYLVKHRKDYYHRQIEEEFEKKNGFPLSWKMWEVRQKLFRTYNEVSYWMEVSPHALVIKKSEFRPPVRRSPKRSDIVEYSMKSRKRFFEALLAMDWGKIESDNVRELTLTYPSIYPKDGQVLKNHLDVYAKRIKLFGEKFGGIAFPWKMEFQRRGAPHFHLILVSGSPIPLEELRAWALTSWSNHVAKWIMSLDGYSEKEKIDAIENHKKAGIEADKVRKNTKSLVCYLVWYIGKGKGKAKEYQHEIPEEYENVGRWWGFYGRNTGLLHISKRRIKITEEDFEEYKERILKTWEKNGKKYKARDAKISLYEL